MKSTRPRGGKSNPASEPALPVITFAGKTYTLLFPDVVRPLTPEERSGLLEDARRRKGILVAVVIDEHNGVIDGINRLSIAAELNLPDVPFDVRSGLTHEQKRDLALSLNAHRRHLTGTEKREAIAEELRRNHEASNRAVGAKVGADHKTVASVRQGLEAGGEIPHPSKCTGRNGKDQAARRTKPSRGLQHLIDAGQVPPDVLAQLLSYNSDKREAIYVRCVLPPRSMTPRQALECVRRNGKGMTRPDVKPRPAAKGDDDADEPDPAPEAVRLDPAVQEAARARIKAALETLIADLPKLGLYHRQNCDRVEALWDAVFPAADR